MIPLPTYGGDEHGGSEVLGKEATHHAVTLSSI